MVICPEINKECEHCMSMTTHGVPELGEAEGIFTYYMCHLRWKNKECDKV